MVSRESRKQTLSYQKESTWKRTGFFVRVISWDNLSVNIFLKELFIFIVDVQWNFKMWCRIERNANPAPQYIRLWGNSQLHFPAWIPKSPTSYWPNPPFKYSLSPTVLYLNKQPTTSPAVKKYESSLTLTLPHSQVWSLLIPCHF